MNLSPTPLRIPLCCALLACLSTPAFAHHGIGLYQPQIDNEWSGTLTKMNLVNPHSYMELDVTKADGSIQHLRCEMRAATLIKRSGWSAEMFKVGAHVELKGHPHRDDPGACYIETFSIDGSAEMGRNDTLSTVQPVDTSNRPLRLADGQLNISGDWAVEQMLLTISPEGERLMIPASLSADVASGKITREQLQAQQPPRGGRIVRTPIGEAAAKAFDSRSPQDNPWFACKPTSLVRDWTADWPINQFVQTTTPEGEKVIDITYGLYNFKRRIHVGMEAHPADITPSYAGHSIGTWEGDTLVVDTIGFEPGVLSPPTRSSAQLHIVERFSLDAAKLALKREYSVTDPIYLAVPYENYDEMYLAETPFEAQVCEEMTPEFQQ